MSVQAKFGQCACIFYFLPTSCPGIIATGSADIFTITHGCLCGTGPAHKSETKQLCLQQIHETSRNVAVPMFKRCFEPTGTFVAVAPDHLARRL